MGFTRGYSVGEEAGWRDGYIFGMRKGAQLSAEIGYYQGFAHAWIALLEREDATKQRKLHALHSLLELTRTFPRTPHSLLESEDSIQKLARIRAKFKQVNALIMSSGPVYQATPSGTPTPNGPFRGASWTSQDSGAGSSFRGVSPQCMHSAGHTATGTAQNLHPNIGRTEMSF